MAGRPTCLCDGQVVDDAASIACFIALPCPGLDGARPWQSVTTTASGRGSRRRNRAADVWRAPLIAADVLVAYQPETDKTAGYSIKDHPYLLNSPTKHAFDQFQCKRALSANQIEFLNMVIDYLTERGVMDPRLLYESPFTDIDAMGVEGVFDSVGVVELIGILDEVRRRAAA